MNTNLIIYLTEDKAIIDNLQRFIDEIFYFKIKIIQTDSIDKLFNILTGEDYIISLLIDDFIDTEVLRQIIEDDGFKYLPKIFLTNNNDSILEKYQLGFDLVVNKNSDLKVLSYHILSISKYKIAVDTLSKSFSELSELNVKRSIQLDLIKKFIPLTVWELSEKISDDQKLVIPEEEKDLALIFADLESFTTISENLSCKETTEILNEIYDVTTQIIYGNSGDIDKFIGDAFLAVFEDVDLAILSALMIQEEINNKKFSKILNNKHLRFRMGLHYGKVIRGNVGGTLRYDNTIIGDTVNTAQRLEGLSKAGGILASKHILEKCKNYDFSSANFEIFQLKGKNKEIEALSLYDYYEDHKEIKNILFKYRMNLKNI